MRRPTIASVATLVAVAGAALFVFVQLQPRLLLTATTTNGGDMGAHVWGPAFMRDHLLPHGRITGWAPDWYAGFSFPTFYFPLPSLLIIALDVILPYQVAFKLVTVAGLVGLPVCAWAFGKLAGLRAPGPAVLAVATLPFLFDRTFTIYGGNIASTLAGEYSYSISLALALLFLGVAANVYRTGRHRGLAVLLLAMTLLSHVVPSFFALVGALVLLALRPSVRRIVDGALVVVLAGMVAAFWALPFVANLAYTNDMAYEKILKYRENLLPHNLRWLVAMAGAGAVVALVMFLSGLWERRVTNEARVGVFLTLMAGLSAIGFWLAPQGKIWNPRILPFWYLSLSLLAGYAVASVGWLVQALTRRARERAARAEAAAREWAAAPGARPSVAAFEGHEPPAEPSSSYTFGAAVHDGAAPVVTVVALLASLVFVAIPLHLPAVEHLPLVPKTSDHSFVPDWAKWNYGGYERKNSYPEYHELIRTMGEVGRSVGCGRAHWEYEGELDQLGTPLALMLLPYWTHGCIGSMEGLYFESSATTPYHFLSASELSQKASRPQRGLTYHNFDVPLGVQHLQLLGAKYFMAFSPEAKAAAAADPDLRLVASTPGFPVNYPTGVKQRSWEIYEVAGSDLVQPLTSQPVVVRGVKGEKAWLAMSEPWYLDPARWGTFLASGGPPEWKRVSAAQAKAPPVTTVPTGVNVSNITTGDDRISFDVDKPGTPVLVKASYFPNWQASGARGPWRVTPNLMVVVPTGRHVSLHYGRSGADWLGTALTVLGLAGVVVLAFVRRRPRQETPSPGLAPEGDAEPDQPPYGADGPAEDWAPRWAGLPDGDGDVGDGETSPLRAEHELGVEQVGAEPAPLDDGEQRQPAHDLHAVGVRDVEAEAPPEDEGEH